MGRRSISFTGGDVQQMDQDIDLRIVEKQLAEEIAEKYFLLTRIKELNEEVDTLKKRLDILENTPTISGDEKTW